MKVAIMQPYLFPYIGYFQLIDSADLFVVYDDVNYIKKGWINRNNILVNAKAHLFSVPLKNASQNNSINAIEIDGHSKWQADLLKTISFSYKKAPYFDQAFPVIENLVTFQENNLSRFIIHSIRGLCDYLQIKTEIIISSEIEKDSQLKGQEKIIEICKRTGATAYINAIGGMELYDKASFADENIALRFIKSKPVSYRQFDPEFIPWLSIIDVLMFNSVDKIKELLEQREFIS